jgi:DNA-binding response OmpR family regulator
VAGPANGHPVPDLMIVDLKLSGLSGFEVLSWARAHATFAKMPIVVLSGSSVEEARAMASGLGPFAFITKHSDYGLIAEEVIDFLLKMGLPANLPPPSLSS